MTHARQFHAGRIEGLARRIARFLRAAPNLTNPTFRCAGAGSLDHQRQTCGDDEVIERSRAFLNLVVGALLYTSDT